MKNEKLIAFSEVKKKLTAVRQYFTGYPSTDQDKLARAVVKLCIEEIDKLKPVDAVKVVRCKDCYHSVEQDRCGLEHRCCKREGLQQWVEDNHFCGYGERRTDNGENHC